MAFLNKINDFAKNISDKTSDAFETTKLNSKINSEKNAASEEYKKIGEFYYNLFTAGGEVAPEVLEFCQTAKAHLDAAAEAQAEIERIKAENEAAKATAATPAPAEGGCPNCGTVNAPGTKFCCGCGSKLEAAPAAQPQNVFCTGCGTPLPVGTKFCSNCGQQLDG